MKSEVIVLCEGSTDETFIRRFLILRGYSHRQIRLTRHSKGQGSGEQFVRANFPAELHEIRRWQAKGLIAMLDGDGKTPAMRKQQLDAACDAAGVPRRKPGEAAVIAVPCRNIETWFMYLHGEPWTETEDYSKQNRDVLAAAAAVRLHDMCYKQQHLAEPAPDSLADACEEWKRFKKSNQG